MKSKKYLSVLLLVIFLSACNPSATQVPPTGTTAPTVTSTTSPTATDTPIPPVYLADLTPISATVGYWTLTAGVYPASDSVMVEGQPIQMLGRTFPKGLFAHAPSTLIYALDEKYKTFVADIFIVPGCSDGARFQAVVDGSFLFEKDMQPGQAPFHVEIPVLDGKKLLLLTDPGVLQKRECDWTVWGDASLTPLTGNVAAAASQNLQETAAFPTWVDEFVHAYGGSVEVDGEPLSADQLTRLILSNESRFTQVRQVNGKGMEFIVVNKVPLALREENGPWQEATMARLSELTGIVFEFSPRVPQDRLPQYISVLKKVAGKGSRFTFPSEMDTCHIYNNFSPENWKAIVSSWDVIQQDLDRGQVPDGYPYEWQGVYDIMDFARSNVEDPQFRAQHVMEIRIDYCMLADSIIKLWESQKFSQADMLKVLEFVVRTRVIQFPQVTTWDVEDEMIAADVVYQTGGGSRYRFWLNATGKTPVELTSLVAGWIKHDRPAAVTVIVEDDVFDTNNPGAAWQIKAFDKYAQGLNAVHAPVDQIIIENNLWIFAPPGMDAISKKIDEFKALGFTIGGSETMIVSGDTAINGQGRPKRVQVTDRNLAQADLYRNLFNLYLDKGITNFGFGGIDDYNPWTNDTGLLGANPLLFDADFRAKPSYYVFVQALFGHIP